MTNCMNNWCSCFSITSYLFLKKTIKVFDSSEFQLPCGKTNVANSSRYLYVCATAVCTYIGVFIVAATGFYAYFVLVLRKQKPYSG